MDEDLEAMGQARAKHASCCPIRIWCFAEAGKSAP
jgi:hypothetical protein